jgi:NAD(P)-dependent dehydrogenase (short-subunit alcohol dehydrogenase family)
MLRGGESAPPGLVDDVAIVTGASSGIGAATACELGRRGAKVVVAARRAEALDEQVRAIQRAGAEALAVPTDVSVASDLKLLVDRTMAEFGRIDVLVNNAGAGWSRPLASSPTDRLVELVEVNLLGALLLTRLVLPGMLERRRGSIISVASLSGRVAMEPLYSATKYGLRGFSLALRRQLKGTGVSVSLVSPGNIRTAMTARVGQRLPEPDLVARTIAGLVTHPRREVVVPRRHYAIAWLEQLLPGVADLTYRRRDWSPVQQEQEGATWRS